MRVISGTARGVRLAPVPRGVRPVSDRAREGLFSSLGGAVRGASVLDLYAGTGGLGIEALSRGADAATFVDRSPAAVRTIRTNLERTGLADRATVVGEDALRFLRRKDNPAAPVNLCFLDPPYGSPPADIGDVLAELASGWLPQDGWTVVLTRRIRSSMPVIPVHWHVARRLDYGDTLVVLFREV